MQSYPLISSEAYKKDILLPVMKILVKSTDLKDYYENFVDFRQPLLLPPAVSELESKSKQVCVADSRKRHIKSFFFINLIVL